MTLADLAAVAAPTIGAFAGGWAAGSRRVRRLERRLVELVNRGIARHELACPHYRRAPEVTPGLHGFRLRGEEGGGP